MTTYNKIEVHSKRLLLRPYKLTDFSRCRQSHINRLPERNKFDHPIKTPSLSAYAGFRARIESYRLKGKLKAHYVFGVFHRKTGEYIGQVDLMVINQQMSWGNLGYQIQNQYWGCGHATEAAQCALKIAFQELGFHRMEAGMELDHKASMKVAKKIGMRYEGIRRKFFADDGGIDMRVYAMNGIDYR